MKLSRRRLKMPREDAGRVARVEDAGSAKQGLKGCSDLGAGEVLSAV